jgi:transposase-like protein
MSTKIPPHCPACTGDGVPLGTLGRLRWFRCRDCGMTYSRQTGTRPKTKSTSHRKEGDPHGNTFRGKPASAG